MDNQRKLDDVSNEEFRDLQETPLDGGDNSDAGSGLINVQEEDIDRTVAEADLDNEIIIDEDDLASDGLSTDAFQVILESDLESQGDDDHIHSPDMDAPNVPGEVDIEDLDEEDLDGTDIPEDARLDRLED